MVEGFKRGGGLCTKVGVVEVAVQVSEAKWKGCRAVANLLTDSRARGEGRAK